LYIDADVGNGWEVEVHALLALGHL